MPSCLDISYLGGFMWFCLDLGGFRWISGIPGVGGLSTCGGDKGRAATPLTNLCSDAGVGRLVDWKIGCPYWKIGILQSCRFGGLDAFMPGHLVFRWIYVVLFGFRWF